MAKPDGKKPTAAKPDAKVAPGDPQSAVPDDATDAPTDAQPTDDAKPESVAGAMTEQQIRDAGLMIDVPFESPPGNPAPLQYADDVGDDKGWQPPEGFTIAGVPYEQVVAGVGSGGSPDPAKGAASDPHTGQGAPPPTDPAGGPVASTSEQRP